MELYILSPHNKELQLQLQTWKFTRMFHLLQIFFSQHFPKHKTLSLSISFEIFYSSPLLLTSFFYVSLWHSLFFFSSLSSDFVQSFSFTYRKTKTLLPTYIKECNNFLTLKNVITFYLKD